MVVTKGVMPSFTLLYMGLCEELVNKVKAKQQADR